jgi:hypothetical protein
MSGFFFANKAEGACISLRGGEVLELIVQSQLKTDGEAPNEESKQPPKHQKDSAKQVKKKTA